MKRTNPTVSLFVFCALFVPLLLAPGPLAAKAHAGKSHAKSVSAKGSKHTKSATKVAAPTVVPLPERNPLRVAAASEASRDSPAASEPAAGPDAMLSAETTGAIAKQPLPHEVPEAQGTQATQSETNISDAPLPDRNPQRPSAASPAAARDASARAPVPVATTTAPKRAPTGAYATILKPLLDYQ